jgi:hypothetical protein
MQAEARQSIPNAIPTSNREEREDSEERENNTHTVLRVLRMLRALRGSELTSADYEALACSLASPPA